MKFITFGKPSLYPGELKEITNTLKSGWLGTGPKSYKFEKFFQIIQTLNTVYFKFLHSCNFFNFKTLGFKKRRSGDYYTSNILFYCKFNFTRWCHSCIADINQETLNIDPQEIEKYNNKNKGINYSPFCWKICDMKSIRKICNKYNLFLIEDCAHAIETRLDNKNAGTFGDLVF